MCVTILLGTKIPVYSDSNINILHSIKILNMFISVNGCGVTSIMRTKFCIIFM